MDTLFSMPLAALHNHSQALHPLPYTMGQVTNLIELARAVRRRSYAPYSHFNVGAAGLFANDQKSAKVYVGANIENAAYSPTFCAECVAVMAARTNKYHELHIMAVCGGPDSSVALDIRKKAAKDWVAPCGRCRQVMAETAHDNCLVVLVRDDDEVMGVRFSELFPLSFGPKNLGVNPSNYRT